MIRFKSVFVFLLGALPLIGQELPLSDLGSDSFSTREAAELAVTNWAKANRARVKERLLKVYLKSDDPEVRRRLIPALEYGYFVPRGYVGVQMMPANFDQLGRPLRGGQVRKGVVVTRVASDTAAEAAGLKAGDVIVKINEWEVPDGAEVTSLVAQEIQKHPPGTPLELHLERDEKPIKVKLVLGVLPVPSERARLIRSSPVLTGASLPVDLVEQLEEFREWLRSEIEKERKNLIADRRL